jgi:MFS family permease
LKDERWNFSAALIDAAGWGLGMSLISHTTFLPLFVSQLTGSPYAIGAISAAMSFGWFLPGLLVAARVERLPTVKGCVLGIAIVERLALLAIVPLILLLGNGHRLGLLIGFFACWLVMNVGMGLNTPGYYKLIAKTVPARWRGRLYGIGGALAGLLGVAGGEAAGRLIKAYGYPYGFVWCFAGAFVVMTASVLPLASLREPAGTVPDPRQEPARGGLRAAAMDPRLRAMVASHALFCGTFMALAFYTEYAIRRFNADFGTIAHFTSTSMAAQVVGYLFIGWVGDRLGNLRALQVSSAAGAVGGACSLLADSAGWLYAVFALAQIATVGWSICWVNYVLELSPTHRSASYVAVVSVALAPFRVGFPLLGSYLVRQLGYQAMFGLACGLTAISLAILLAWAAEPRETAECSCQKSAR